MLHFQRSGHILDFSKKNVGDLSFEDLIHSIAYEKRYSGNINWTVLQHSLVMGRAAKLLNYNNKLVRYCYLHDVHEGIIRDVPTPFKQAIGKAWYDMEHGVQYKLYDTLGQSDLKGLETDEKFKVLDKAAAYYEAMFFFGSDSQILEYLGYTDSISFIFPIWKKAFKQINGLEMLDEKGEVLEKWVIELKECLKQPVA